MYIVTNRATHIYCQQCDYVLDGLDRNVCPECGRAFDPADRTTVAQRPGHARRVRLGRLSRLGLLLSVIFLLAVTVWPSRHGWSSVCTRCGAFRWTREYYLGQSRITVYRSHGFLSSPFNDAVVRHGALPTHAHTFAHSTLLKARVSGSRAVSFIDNLIRYTNKATADKWIRRLLDVDIGTAVFELILGERFPKGGFSTRSEFTTWWTPQRVRDLEEMVEYLIAERARRRYGG